MTIKQLIKEYVDEALNIPVELDYLTMILSL